MEKSGFHFVVFLLFWITKAATIWAQIVSRRHWWSIKADFHSRRSRSRKSVSDPAKIESRSPQRSTELDKIGPGESKRFYFLAIPLKTPILMNQRKQDCRRRMQKRKRQPIVMPVFRPSKGLTPTIKFPLNRRRRNREQHRYFSTDSVGLISTWSYRSTLLIMTLTPS